MVMICQIHENVNGRATQCQNVGQVYGTPSFQLVMCREHWLQLNPLARTVNDHESAELPGNVGGNPPGDHGPRAACGHAAVPTAAGS